MHKGYQRMWFTWDLFLENAERTKDYKFELLGSYAAIKVFTLGSRFKYKGTKTMTFIS